MQHASAGPAIGADARERPAARRDHAGAPSVIKTAGHVIRRVRGREEPGTPVEEVTVRGPALAAPP